MKAGAAVGIEWLFARLGRRHARLAFWELAIIDGATGAVAVHNWRIGR